MYYNSLDIDYFILHRIGSSSVTRKRGTYADDRISASYPGVEYAFDESFLHLMVVYCVK